MKFKFAAVFILITSFIHSAEIKWLKNVDTALAEAKKSNKLIMIDVYTDWCSWCTKLDQTTYKDPGVVKLSESFINLKVNPETDKTANEFLKKYKITGYPTILFIDHESNTIDIIGGYLAADKFAPRMEEAYKIRDNLLKYSQEIKNNDWTHALDLFDIYMTAAKIDEALIIFNKLNSENKIPKEDIELIYLTFADYYINENKYDTALEYAVKVQALNLKTDYYYQSFVYSAYLLVMKNDKAQALNILNKLINDGAIPAKWKDYYKNYYAKINKN